MKSLTVLCGLCGLTLAAIIGATIISHQHFKAPVHEVDRQMFNAHGKILSVESDGKTVHIAHEAIPGFMPAMNMPFSVSDGVSLARFTAGDEVKFELVVTKDDSWIARLEKADSAAPAPAPEAAYNTVPALQSGQLVPDFSLVDQNGRPVHLLDWRGKVLVLTFIYTRCPLPNYCPLMSRNFADLHARFEKEFPGRVQLLSISFDPQFDTPAVLKQYAELVAKDEKNWTFATGTASQIDFVTGLFNLYREPANGFITHDLRTALISPDGHLVQVWRSNVWTPYEVQRMVRETLQPSLAGR